MHRGSYILGLAFLGVLALPGAPASAQPYSDYRRGTQVDVGMFYDDLAPYGEWVEMEDYGWSWAPRVERGWRPYTRGQWVMTDYGWYWDSDERFGWAAYHYGRWVNDPYYGWIWVPGTEWAPAWVSWRHGNGYTGWAPLPPRATWRTRVGLSIGGLEIDAFIGARDYAFVRDRAFVDRGVYQQLLPQTQNVTIINVTNNVTNYTVANDRVFNGGIPVASVERAVGRRLPRARTVDVDRADAPRRARADEVAVFRPAVTVSPERRPAQGRSLVKGEQPPPLLVERRQAREQERQQKGNVPEVTARDVAQRRPADQPRAKAQRPAAEPQAPRPDARPSQPEAQRQRDQARRDADQQQAKGQEQQRLEREKRQANDQQQRDQQQADRQRANRDREAQAQAGKDAEQQRAKGQEQQRLDREKRQAADQPQHPPQADKQPAKRDGGASPQAGKRAKGAPQAAKDNPKDKDKDKDNKKE